LAGCGGASFPAAPSRRIEFVVLEDYDKGADLAEVELDFRRFRELGATGWRGSFGWDDYEPVPGRYEFGWLQRFAELSRRYGLTLRPYLGYTPRWAAMGRNADGQDWNDPPRRASDFARFAARLAVALRRHGAVASYEIYNEENTRQWWDGSAEEYAHVYAETAESLRAAVPGVEILPGGLVWPDADWLRTVCETASRPIAAAAVHLYAETWSPDSVTLERAIGELRGQAFRETMEGACGGPPLWANEIGFATAHGRSERDQAEWWVRAIAGLASDPRIALIGLYEIKDLPPGRDVIGEPENYHLGLLRADRTPKLAFRTVRLLLSLFGQAVEPARVRVRMRAPEGDGAPPEVRAFRRVDGRQLLFAWVPPAGRPATFDVDLSAPGRSAVSYALDGTPSPAQVAGRAVGNLRVEPGSPRVLLIEP
jgi:polysaccharide biosynthesis protein PslG